MKENSGKYNLLPEVESCLPCSIPHGPPTTSFVNAVANGKLHIVIGECYAHLLCPTTLWLVKVVTPTVEVVTP